MLNERKISVDALAQFVTKLLIIINLFMKYSTRCSNKIQVDVNMFYFMQQVIGTGNIFFIWSPNYCDLGHTQMTLTTWYLHTKLNRHINDI